MHTIVLYPAKLPSLTYHHPHHRSYEMVTQIYADREDNFTLAGVTHTLEELAENITFVTPACNRELRNACDSRLISLAHAGWPGHNNEDSSDEKTDEKGITDDDESDGYRQQGNKVQEYVSRIDEEYSTRDDDADLLRSRTYLTKLSIRPYL
ncbi:hypothetical protein FPOA_07703 [Fusarium poae]|uniref:Uncharacterized protein n=1 Tax=Fusarium poae TaxID=36050 RepID=A0A1B8ALA8_FUSPO|nr:hypothetical protein FPOA_07703 [Fusarium poae]